MLKRNEPTVRMRNKAAVRAAIQFSDDTEVPCSQRKVKSNAQKKGQNIAPKKNKEQFSGGERFIIQRIVHKGQLWIE